MVRSSAALVLMVGAAGKPPHHRGRNGAHMFGNGESIWGECESYDKAGCTINSDFQCSSLSSEGPANARWEIKLTDLPASTATSSVHLHWWAGRPFEPSYDILSRPDFDNCPSMSESYPKYSDDDFNGGNVEVSEDGNAIIKVHSPAPYSFSCGASSHHRHHERNHHIHFRFCSGERTLFKTGKIDFSDHGVYIKGPGGPRHSNGADDDSYSIEYVKDLTTGDVRVPTSTNSYHNLFGQWINQSSQQQSSTDQDGSDAEPLVVLAREDFNTEKPDMDALEFSAVYDCMEKGLLFSQLANSCTEKCEDDQATSHSQCVRKKVSHRPVHLAAHWQLCLDCDRGCWAERAEETLHTIRLALGDLLDVPWQEAKSVRMRFDTVGPRGPRAGGRRLQTAAEGFKATLSVEVVTGRVGEVEGNELLASYMNSNEDAESVLGMTVFDIVADHKLAPEVLADGLQNGEGDDLYLEHYAKLEVNLSDDVHGGDQEGTPVALLVGISVVVFAGASFLSALFCYRRRKVALQMVEEAAVAVEADKLGKLDKQNPEMPAAIMPQLQTGSDQHPNPMLETAV